MTVISPCVTPKTNDPREYQAQLEKITAFASRVHIDVMDGEFAPTRSIDLSEVWWPENVTADIHLMYQNPVDDMETLVNLGANMVVIHAEAAGPIDGLMKYLRENGIKAGIALLQYTTPESVKHLIELADHVLVFSGDLGKFGGTADLGLLEKVAQIRAINSAVEIGWDGGVNAENIEQIASRGVDVINVGGAIQNAVYAQDVYENLKRRLNT